MADQPGPEAKEVIVTTAERLRAEGKDEGRVEGKAEGKAEGRAEALLELLQQKFGPVPDAVGASVRSADVAQLQRWTSRVLEARDLDGVFHG
ncbi:hypothetical protein [Nocardia sp. NPDC051832]|uniref:hypothetical protein n=1 Tax=Nocardia sp. NPDC051832 TaxID=3155673 RepID=UPI003446856E